MALESISSAGWVDQRKSFGLVIPLVYLILSLWVTGLAYVDVAGCIAHGHTVMMLRALVLHWRDVEGSEVEGLGVSGVASPAGCGREVTEGLGCPMGVSGQ